MDNMGGNMDNMTICRASMDKIYGINNMWGYLNNTCGNFNKCFVDMTNTSDVYI